MNRARVPLYDFLPYGAPELLEVRESYLTRALTTASSGMIVLFAIALATSLWLAKHPIDSAPSFDRVITLQPPPALDIPVLPRLQTSLPVAPPASTARPVPVRDEVAPTDVTVPSQDELRRTQPGDAQAGDGGPVTIAPPTDEATPTLNEYRYYDQAPGLVTQVKPSYPDLARDAGVDGTVMLRVLVGKDGRVKDVHVDRSIPLLDDAAVAAVKQWVFTPALVNDHAIAVWVAVPVRFTLH